MDPKTAYLNQDPNAVGLPEPPVMTLASELPLYKLTWQNFERLCWRLVQRMGDVEHAQLFGAPGQDQAGIDLYARLGSGDFYVFQCRRTATMGPADIRRAVSDFMKSPWFEKAGTFVLCAVQSFVETGRANEVEKQAARLKKRDPNKVFLPWGRDLLSEELRPHRDLVRTFFGDAWEAAFCGHSQPQEGQLQPFWSVRDATPTFAFREDELRAVDDLISAHPTSPRVVVAHGLGGVGKSQLAAAWASRHREEYAVGAWLAGPDRTQTISNLAQFARSSGVALAEDDEQRAFEKLRTSLATQAGGWLLIIDDFDDVAALPDLMPASGDGTVLVTSRRARGWRAVGGAPFEVGPWSIANTARFLCETSGDNDEAAARAIAEALGGLPLAAAQAAAYVDETGGTLASYWQMVEERAPDLLDASQAPQYELTVRTTWLAAFE